MNHPNKIHLATQIYKQLLVQKKITAYVIAKQSGIDKTYLSKLAGGKIKKPGTDKLRAIASVLQIELKQLQQVFYDPEKALLELNLKLEAQSTVTPNKAYSLRQDWGNAPDSLV